MSPASVKYSSSSPDSAPMVFGVTVPYPPYYSKGSVALDDWTRLSKIYSSASSLPNSSRWVDLAWRHNTNCNQLPTRRHYTTICDRNY